MSEDNFVFGFNDFDFSDRILRLEVTPEDGDEISYDSSDEDEEEDYTISLNKLKAEKYNNWFSSIRSTEDSDSSGSVFVTNLHICSLVLAAKSPFFYKLFKNGMKESQQKSEVCLKINASEETTLRDLLRFMYGNRALDATSFTGLVDLLIAADKFEVTSCMSYCVEKLFKFPMSIESALFYLELPSSVLVSEIVKPLIDAAKKYVFSLYRDFTKSQDKAMQLPLSAIEAVLGSEGLQVVSEDVVYDFILKWARALYPELEERREILTKRLAPLICFPNMSATKLKEVLACADFDHEHVSKLVYEAVFSKLERSDLHLTHKSISVSTSELGSAGRNYNPHCVVFFDLPKDQFYCLSSSNRIYSPEFRLGRMTIYLSECCASMNEQFGLYVYKTSSESCTIDLEVAVMKKSSRKFESKLKVNKYTVNSCGSWGSTPKLLDLTMAELTRSDSDYIINGVLCLRAEITLVDS